MLRQQPGALLAICLALFCAPGCAAMMAARQPGKKDLALVVEGTPRTHVIAELGTPLWSDNRDGQVTDVFAFKQGYHKLTKATRALTHGVADVATGGLWEVVGIPAETLADGTDVKLEVQYDSARNVHSVKVIEGESAMTKRGWFGRRKKSATPSQELTSHSTHGQQAERMTQDELESRYGAGRGAAIDGQQVRGPADEQPADEQPAEYVDSASDE